MNKKNGILPPEDDFGRGLSKLDEPKQQLSSIEGNFFVTEQV